MQTTTHGLKIPEINDVVNTTVFRDSFNVVEAFMAAYDAKFSDTYTGVRIADCNSIINGSGWIYADTLHRPPGTGFLPFFSANGGQIAGGWFRLRTSASTNSWLEWTALPGLLPLIGGTMSGAIAMGGNKITGLGVPTSGADAVTKTYVDGLLTTTGKNINYISGTQIVVSKLSLIGPICLYKFNLNISIPGGQWKVIANGDLSCRPALSPDNTRFVIGGTGGKSGLLVYKSNGEIQVFFDTAVQNIYAALQWEV